MKLRLEELIIGKYYICLADVDTYCFKFKGYDSDNIYCYNFQLIQDRKIEHVFNYEDDIIDSFCEMDYYKKCKIFKEVNIEYILYYLPDTNIDKKFFIRKNKINSLLSII